MKIEGEDLKNFKNIAEFFDNIPNFVINAITILSFLAMPISFLTQLILIWFKKSDNFNFNILYLVFILGILIISCIRIKKYRNLSHSRMKVVSSNFRSFLKQSQSVYFETMKLHKENKLTVELLKDKYQNELIKILNCLCKIMKNYTCREVSACIKIINFNSGNPIIDLDNATVSTLCRSENSIGRGEYEGNTRPIYIKENTDFREIVDQTINTGKSYFYVRDLEEYDKLLFKHYQRRYENTNVNYLNSYKSTIVVPIRIETEKLYDIKNKNKYNVIGFLCVDSLSTDAFLSKQEKFNCNIVKAFANNIYVLLGQYAHYLKTF